MISASQMEYIHPGLIITLALGAVASTLILEVTKEGSWLFDRAFEGLFVSAVGLFLLAIPYMTF